MGSTKTISPIGSSSIISVPLHLEFKIPPFPENSHHPLEYGNHPHLLIYGIKRNSTYRREACRDPDNVNWLASSLVERLASDQGDMSFNPRRDIHMYLCRESMMRECTPGHTLLPDQPAALPPYICT